jgi:hypothetical protein
MIAMTTSNSINVNARLTVWFRRRKPIFVSIFPTGFVQTAPHPHIRRFSIYVRRMPKEDILFSKILKSLNSHP